MTRASTLRKLGIFIFFSLMVFIIWKWANAIDISALKLGMSEQEVDKILVKSGGATKVRIPLVNSEVYLYCYTPIGNYLDSIYYMSDVWREDITVTYKNKELQSFNHRQSLQSDFCK